MYRVTLRVLHSTGGDVVLKSTNRMVQSTKHIVVGVRLVALSPTQHRGIYVADTISLLYTLMYINITRFGYIQRHTALQTTVGLHQQNYRGQSVLKILNGGVKSLNYPTPPGSKFPISWEGWRCELGWFNPPTPPSNLTLRCIAAISRQVRPT